MKSKKGLDTVVTTLIIVLLAIVAVGIVWVVVRNVVNQGASQVSINNKCLQVSLSAVGVKPVTGSPGNYTVTLVRNTGQGSDAIDGIKVNFFNATSSSGLVDFPALAEGQTKIVTLDSSSGGTLLVNATRIDFEAYFIDSSGNQQICGNTQSFTF